MPFKGQVLEPFGKPQWFPNQLRGSSSQGWTRWLGCLIRGSNPSLPPEKIPKSVPCPSPSVPSTGGGRSWPDQTASPPFLPAFVQFFLHSLGWKRAIWLVPKSILPSSALYVVVVLMCWCVKVSPYPSTPSWSLLSRYGFSQWTHQYTFLPTMYGSLFSILSPTLVMSCLFYNIHSNRWEWYFTVVLMCISLMIREVKHHVLVSHLYVFRGKIPIQSLSPFFFF